MKHTDTLYYFVPVLIGAAGEFASARAREDEALCGLVGKGPNPVTSTRTDCSDALVIGAQV